MKKVMAQNGLCEKLLVAEINIIIIVYKYKILLYFLLYKYNKSKLISVFDFRDILYTFVQ